jgi:hypothetical protein
MAASISASVLMGGRCQNREPPATAESSFFVTKLKNALGVAALTRHCLHELRLQKMLTPADLRAIAHSRLQDAHILFANARYDGAGYVCGYAVELILKAGICDTLNWPGYPASRNEFTNLLSFKTHNLDVLLSLSGRE